MPSSSVGCYNISQMKSYLLDKLRANLTDEINQRLATSHEFEINPANPKTGAHFAIPLFSLAKELGKDPSELAQQLEKETFPHPVEKSQATGGFLNLWLDPKLIAQELELEEGENYKYGELPWINEGKVAVCDYPSPNIAKPLSVGHLRVMVQGQQWISYSRQLASKQSPMIITAIPAGLSGYGWLASRDMEAKRVSKKEGSTNSLNAT